MRAYLVSLAVGILVGVVYGLLDVRSPAPPTVALVGLLGILIGEQVVPHVRQLAAETALAGWYRSRDANSAPTLPRDNVANPMQSEIDSKSDHADDANNRR